MNRAPAATDNIEQHVTESIHALLSAMRAIAQPAASVNAETLKREVLEDFARQVAGPLKARVCDELRKELSGVTGNGSGAVPSADEIVKICVQRAEQLFVAPAWQKAVQSIIQEALQSVLPGLIKRLREDIDKRLGEGGGSGGHAGGGGSSIAQVINSAEMKEMIEERFRMMLLYLKQEVIPKAVQAARS